MKIKWIMLLVLLPGALALAQGGVAREIIESAAETLLRQSGKEAARDLAEMGGRVAVKEILEKAGQEGGEKLVARTVSLGVEHGPQALRAIALSPRAMITALDGLAPELRSAAIAAVAREPQLVNQLIARFGGEALETAARHPGVGAHLVDKLGQEGIQAGRSLATDQAIVIARHADEIRALAPAERQTFMQMLGKSPGRVVAFMEAHPKTLLTAGGVALFMANKDEILGTAATATSAGKTGLIERGIKGTADYFKTPIMVLCGIILAGVLIKTITSVRRHARKQS